MNVLNGGSLAGFYVCLGGLPLALEHVDDDTSKPEVLLYANGRVSALFSTKSGAQDAIRSTRRQARAEGYDRDTAAYQIVPLYASK